MITASAAGCFDIGRRIVIAAARGHHNRAKISDVDDDNATNSFANRTAYVRPAREQSEKSTGTRMVRIIVAVRGGAKLLRFSFRHFTDGHESRSKLCQPWHAVRPRESPRRRRNAVERWPVSFAKSGERFRRSFLRTGPPCRQDDGPTRRLERRAAFLQRSGYWFRRNSNNLREVRFARQNEMPLSANSMFLASASCAVILKRCGASASALLRGGRGNRKCLARCIETSRLPTGAEPARSAIWRMKSDSVYSNALRSPLA